MILLESVFAPFQTDFQEDIFKFLQQHTHIYLYFVLKDLCVLMLHILKLNKYPQIF